jgi:hypothetical protein
MTIEGNKRLLEYWHAVARANLLLEIERAIDDGTYETPERIRATAEALAPEIENDG